MPGFPSQFEVYSIKKKSVCQSRNRVWRITGRLNLAHYDAGGFNIVGESAQGVGSRILCPNTILVGIAPKRMQFNIGNGSVNNFRKSEFGRCSGIERRWRAGDKEFFSGVVIAGHKDLHLNTQIR